MTPHEFSHLKVGHTFMAREYEDSDYPVRWKVATKLGGVVGPVSHMTVRRDEPGDPVLAYSTHYRVLSLNDPKDQAFIERALHSWPE